MRAAALPYSHSGLFAQLGLHSYTESGIFASAREYTALSLSPLFFKSVWVLQRDATTLLSWLALCMREWVTAPCATLATMRG